MKRDAESVPDSQIKQSQGSPADGLFAARHGSDLSRPVQPSLMLEMLERMHLLRAFDRRVGVLCKRKVLPGLIHLGIGEEAVAVGTCAALRPSDKVTSTHR